MCVRLVDYCCNYVYLFGDTLTSGTYMLYAGRAIGQF